MSEDKTAELALKFDSNEEDCLDEMAAARAELARDLTMEAPADEKFETPENVAPAGEVAAEVPPVVVPENPAPVPESNSGFRSTPGVMLSVRNEPLILRSRQPANRPAGTQPLNEEHIDKHSGSADAAIAGKSFGAALRILREQHGLDYKALEKETLIQPRYLEALENENLSVLPPVVYVIAYIRTLGRFYKLSNEAAQNLIAGLKSQMEYSCNDELIGSVKVDTSGEVANEQRLRKFMLMSLSAVVLLIAFISGGIYLALRDPAPEVQTPEITEKDPASGEIFDRNTIYPLLEPPTLELPKLPVAE